MKETLIYGLAKDETRDYMEELLSTNCQTQEQIDKVLTVASEHGYHSFRIAYYNGEKPDFTRVLNV